jgi:hypothetical protein
MRDYKLSRATVSRADHANRMTMELASQENHLLARCFMAELSVVWTWMMMGALAALPLSILLTLWRVVSYKRELAAAMTALREVERATEEFAPKDVLWNGDKAYSTDVPIEEIEHRIREALNLRRREQASRNVC